MTNVKLLVHVSVADDTNLNIMKQRFCDAIRTIVNPVRTDQGITTLNSVRILDEDEVVDVDSTPQIKQLLDDEMGPCDKFEPAFEATKGLEYLANCKHCNQPKFAHEPMPQALLDALTAPMPEIRVNLVEEKVKEIFNSFGPVQLNEQQSKALDDALAKPPVKIKTRELPSWKQKPK